MCWVYNARVQAVPPPPRLITLILIARPKAFCSRPLGVVLETEQPTSAHINRRLFDGALVKVSPHALVFA